MQLCINFNYCKYDDGVESYKFSYSGFNMIHYGTQLHGTYTSSADDDGLWELVHEQIIKANISMTRGDK